MGAFATVTNLLWDSGGKKRRPEISLRSRATRSRIWPIFLDTCKALLTYILRHVLLKIFFCCFYKGLAENPLNVTDNQIKCDLLRTMPNNERFRSPESDGVGFNVKAVSHTIALICEKISALETISKAVVALLVVTMETSLLVEL